MYLNTLKPALGSKTKKRRLGRGIGSGFGKTAAKGHKGQKARAGGYHKVGFEGGQTPLKRRLPKFGFYSRIAPNVAEVRLGDLNKLEISEISLETLKINHIVKAHVQKAKIILSGSITRSIKIKGLGITKGAREAILSVGGSIE